jgi:hypothetical protein
MIPITFRATFLPAVKKFKVEVTTPKQRWIELMTIAQFQRFAKDEKPLSIGGMTVEFDNDDDGSAMTAIKQYFRNVADGYAVHMGWIKVEQTQFAKDTGLQGASLASAWKRFQSQPEPFGQWWSINKDKY